MSDSISEPSDHSGGSRLSVVSRAKRVVIKLGTAVIMRDEGGVALSRFYSFVEGIAGLMRTKHEMLLVSSGAVGLGAERLGLPGGSQLLSIKQACAAVGQGRLMALYSDAFEKLGIASAQVLLTEEDFTSRNRYLNLRSTVTKLLELGVLPIINENDTVSTSEIEALDSASYRRVNFGDNDKLSALVAGKIEADLLVILTDVEGLFSGDPAGGDDAHPIPLVVEITPEIEALASEPVGIRKSGPGRGRGGMRTKLEAAEIATRSGCAVIIANGKLTGVIERIFSGEPIGTLFLPGAGLTGRRRWIAFATTVKAAVVVNEGARRALTQRGASLLAAGILEVRGSFGRGDVVSIIDEKERELARGIVNYSSDETRRISGLHSDKIDELIEDRNYDALITRDNMAFL
jgi:glutamate 5-kinase